MTKKKPYAHEDRNDYRGAGRIRCFICDKPVRDHVGYQPCNDGSGTGEIPAKNAEAASRSRSFARPPDGTACTDAKGTNAGYHRHRRRDEGPCAACAEAHTEYSRVQWASRSGRRTAHAT